MHCLTVTHGMQEFTSPQSVDVSVKTLKEDSFSSSPLLFSLWPQPLPFFLSIQFHFICTKPKQQSSQGACHSLFCFLFLYHLTCTNFLHTVEGKKTIITLKNFSISHVIQQVPKELGQCMKSE